MKKITLLITLLFSVVVVFGQCPTTNIILSSQAEIDNFAISYPNCTVLTHELKINEQNGPVNNLFGLSLITSAQEIFIVNTQIENFLGLHNLVEISDLAIWGNVKLQNLYGLNSLQTMNRFEAFINVNLIDLSGMNAIQSINNINLFGNSSLIDISDLSFIEILNSLSLGGNGLTSLTGLENLNIITGDLNIDNEPVTNLDELANLEKIGGSLYITSNNQLQNIFALSNIETLENLYIIECPSLENLIGLNSLHTVNKKLRVGFNHGLTTMYGLINITDIEDLEIYENNNMFTLKGLESLNKVTKRILINDNPALNNLEHISYISPNELDDLIMINNDSLEVCNYPLICAIINEPTVYKVIHNNAPGCNSEEEVELSCQEGFNDPKLDTNETSLASQLLYYPNPVSEILTINVSEYFTYNKAIVFSLIGKKLFETTNEKIDFSSLSDGIYFVVIETDKESSTIKIIKE